MSDYPGPIPEAVLCDHGHTHVTELETPCYCGHWKSHHYFFDGDEEQPMCYDCQNAGRPRASHAFVNTVAAAEERRRYQEAMATAAAERDERGGE